MTDNEIADERAANIRGLAWLVLGLVLIVASAWVGIFLWASFR